MKLTAESLSLLPRTDREELLELLEEKRRRKAKATLAEYVKAIDLPGAPVTDDEDCEQFYPETISPALHHSLLIEKLQDVAESRIKRLMILMPPGSAKSSYASVLFPTWFMGRYANKNIIMVTYGSDLAKKFGRKCRQIIRGKAYQEIMGTSLTGDNAAVDDWSLKNGSTYMCGGILSGITGNRADGAIIDDPFKGREDADSETIRAKTREEYISSVKTRIKPSGWEILINTRWHENDLSGGILPDGYAGESGWITARDGEQWYVLCIQAQCEREDDPIGRKLGEYLWTEWFPVEWWEQTKRTQSTPSGRNWSALYQQRPAPEDGDYFKREWLRWYDRLPRHLRYYGSSDYAVTDKGGDYTVHLVAGVDPNDDIYLVELWRDRTDSLEWVEVLIELILLYKPMEWAEEAGQIRRSMDPLITKRQAETKAFCFRKQFPSVTDKKARAQAIRGRMAQGKVYLPTGKHWVPDFVTELLKFDSGKHDDQVDALSLLGRMLAEMCKGEEPKQPVAWKPPEPPTIEQMLKNHIRNKSRQRDDD
jgi:predicted phage terminase large subunit-like protein